MTEELSRTQKQEPIQDNGKRRNKAIFKTALLLLLIGLAASVYWFLFIRFRASTDDAYVGGNNLMIMSPQSGIAVKIFADDTDYVEQGQLLVQLDQATFELAFEKAKVNLALAARQVRQLQEDVEQKKAGVELRRAELNRAREDFESRATITNLQAISKEDLNHARADLNVAESSLNLAHHQLEASIAALGHSLLEDHPTIQQAIVPLKEAYLNFQRARILAPVNGFIAKRSVQVGEWVTPTRALMSVIPLSELWVDANFKETELGDIRLGQPVTLTTDLYGSSVVYHGRVNGLVAGTGSVFSLLPPQNASGNWIKIVQRVPVRVHLNPKELKHYPLLLGLSAYVTVDTSNLKGQILTAIPSTIEKLTTPVFDVSMQSVDDLIKMIIQSNLYSSQLNHGLSSAPNAQDSTIANESLSMLLSRLKSLNPGGIRVADSPALNRDPYISEPIARHDRS